MTDRAVGSFSGTGCGLGAFLVLLSSGVLVAATLGVFMWINSNDASATLALEERGRLTAADVLKEAGGSEGLGVRIVDVALSPAGVVAAIVRDAGGRTWLARALLRGAAEPPKVVEVCGTAQVLSTSPDGALVVGCADGGTRYRRVERYSADLERISQLKLRLKRKDSGHPTRVVAPAFSPSLRRAAVATNSEHVEVFDLGDGRLLSTLTATARGAEVAHMAFSAGGRRLAVAYNDGVVQIFSVDSPERAAATLTPAEEDEGPMVAFSPDASMVAVASFWGRFHLWATDGALISSDPGSDDIYGQNSVAFPSPGLVYQIRAGQLLARSSSGELLAEAPEAAAARGFGGPGKGLVSGYRHIEVEDDMVLLLTSDGKTAILSKVTTE